MSNLKLYIARQDTNVLPGVSPATAFAAYTSPAAGAIDCRLWERVFKDPGHTYKLLAMCTSTTTSGSPALLKELDPSYSGREMYLRCEVSSDRVSLWNWHATQHGYQRGFAKGEQSGNALHSSEPTGGVRCWYYRVTFDSNNQAASSIVFQDSSLDNKSLSEWLVD